MEDAAAMKSLPQAWTTRQVVFLCIASPVMLAAFLEWLLFLATFCYCLIKAFKKADHWSQRILAACMMFFFVALRAFFLPVMMVTLPLPNTITYFFPETFAQILRESAFGSFALLLTVPWLLCTYRMIVYPYGRRNLSMRTLTQQNAPKIMVIMPVYKEPADSLLKALNSVVNCDYPGGAIHVFLSFDGDEVDELYLTTLERLGIPITLREFPQSIDLAYNGVRVTVSRFPHGGKRHCQKATYLLINKIYARRIELGYDDMFLLFIDSDCILDRLCIRNFMHDMELSLGNNREMLAMTGVLTSFAEKTNFITLLQDIEYIHSQLYERSVESVCGSVTCLPGALTMLRFTAFRNMARFYFSDEAENCEDLFDYAKTQLGEDRWLTHLFMLGARKRYQIQLCTTAFCKTEAVTTFKSLLKQRRRWFLGFVSNEVCMLTDTRLWRKYPVLCLIRFLTNTVQTTALLFTIMVMSIASGEKRFSDLPWQFILISCAVNWLMMGYFAIRLKRGKAALYPLMFFTNPFMNWIYLVYGILTSGKRTWGGPRYAKAAVATLQPADNVEGQFVAEQRAPDDGLACDSGVSIETPKKYRKRASQD